MSFPDCPGDVAGEARPVSETAAEFVSPLVQARAEERTDQIVVAKVNLDRVEADVTRSPGTASGRIQIWCRPVRPSGDTGPSCVGANASGTVAFTTRPASLP